MPGDPVACDPTRPPARHLRLVAGGAAPPEEAMRPLEAGELRRVTGRPASGPAPQVSPTVEPW